MIIAHYQHRLPTGYDLGAIRKRAQERGADWDAVPDLYFKAFLLREAGRFGAIANSYSSLYLWRHDQAFGDWLVSGGYEVVTDSFGRAEIETLLALDAIRGTGGEARFLYRDDIAISVDADLTAAFAREIDLARERSTEPHVIAAIVGLDPRQWKLVRVLLSAAAPQGTERGAAYQILHLAHPLLETLKPGATP